MEIDFNKNKDGLVPVIVQDVKTKNVLMLGYMNEEAYSKTLNPLQTALYCLDTPNLLMNL